MGVCISSMPIAPENGTRTIPTAPQQSLTLKQKLDPFKMDFSEFDFSNWDDTNLSFDADEDLFGVAVDQEQSNICLSSIHMTVVPLCQKPAPRRCIQMAMEEEMEKPSSPSFHLLPACADLKEAAFILAHTARITWHHHKRQHAKRKHDNNVHKIKHVVGVYEQDFIHVLLRPIISADKDSLAAGLSVLSDESKISRFFSMVNFFSDAQLENLCVCNEDRFAWSLNVHCKDLGWVSIGVGRFIREKKDPTRAEVAFTILDRWQGLGMASLLSYATAQAARTYNIKILCGCVLTNNKSAMRLLENMTKSGSSLQTHKSNDGDLTAFELELPLLDREGIPLNGQLNQKDMKAVIDAAAGKNNYSLRKHNNYLCTKYRK